MNKILLLCFVLSILLISSAYCLAKEEKDHVCFRTVDKDKDGKVTYQEFLKVFGEDEKKFKAIDQDNDGNLTHDEYHQSLGHGAK